MEALRIITTGGNFYILQGTAHLLAKLYYQLRFHFNSLSRKET